MKVAFVVPRYGPDIIGGAETAARLLAEHLAARAGWTVDVLTTCAQDFVTWADVYPAGSESVNGVTVHRFRSAAGREPSFHPFSAGLLADPGAASRADADRWIDLQGPVTPALADAALSSDADVLVFYPYLYYPTVRIITRATLPTVLHPAAHDEPALRLPVFPEVFGAADGLVFQTAAERALVQATFPVASHRQILLGLGVDDPDSTVFVGTPGNPRALDPPYLLCLGRVDRHKGSSALAAMFAAYKERHRDDLRLVFAGPVVEEPPAHPCIDVLGPVSEAAKWELLAGAVAVVSPSRWEAFSLVVAEAWSARTPVVVNAACGPTSELCRRSGGGVPVDGFGAFEAVVQRLSGDAAMAAAMGRFGRAFVDRELRWPIVVERYAGFLRSVADAGGR